jgi:hypothetical protein
MSRLVGAQPRLDLLCLAVAAVLLVVCGRATSRPDSACQKATRAAEALVAAEDRAFDAFLACYVQDARCMQVSTDEPARLRKEFEEAAKECK